MAGDEPTGTAYPMRTLTYADVAAMLVDMRELGKAMRVANPPHPAPDVEDAPRDAQPARLSGEVL